MTFFIDLYLTAGEIRNSKSEKTTNCVNPNQIYAMIYAKCILIVVPTKITEHYPLKKLLRYQIHINLYIYIFGWVEMSGSVLL
jgi:hypothetical protein